MVCDDAFFNEFCNDVAIYQLISINTAQ